MTHAQMLRQLRRDAATLWQCTLVPTVEPCALCAGTQYWAHIAVLHRGFWHAA